MLYISEDTEFQLKNTAVSLGKFDGIHLGHRLLIDRILREKDHGYTSVVFTFDLHPMSLFSDNELELIDTQEEKVEKLRQLGVDVLVSYPFTRETANTPPEQFVREILVKQLDAKLIVVGSDYRFGKQRQGDVALLQALSTECGYELVVYDKLEIDHEIVSSTYIRQELALGHMERVNQLLGETFTIRGEVVHGKQLGRTIGVPTVNQVVPSKKQMPPNGVYYSKVRVDNQWYHGITSIGFKPTVSDEKIKGVETYLFDYTGDLYGKEIEVGLLHYSRPEVRFESLEQLKSVIQEDIRGAECYFAQRK